MGQDPRQPRASIACSRNRDPQYLELAATVEGLAAVAVFDAMLCAAKDQGNEGTFTAPRNVIAMMCGVPESIFIQSVIKLASLNWLTEIKDGGLIIRSFSKWNPPAGQGGPRPGAGRPPIKKSKYSNDIQSSIQNEIKANSNTIQTIQAPLPLPSPVTTTTLAASPPVGEVLESEKQKPFAYPADFETFYTNYPRKAAKGAALRAWKKLGAEDKKLAIERAEWVAGCWQHYDPHGERAHLCQMPATWLNARGWEDADESVVLMARGK